MVHFTHEQLNVLSKAIKTYGIKNQEDIAIEEMSELTKAIIKNRRYNSLETSENIREEIADVLIMLIQLMSVYNNKPHEAAHTVGHFAFKKINRLRQRLVEEDKELEAKMKLVDEVYSKIPQRGSSFSVSKDCKNLEESFGEICVKCNACGRLDCKINQNIESCVL